MVMYIDELICDLKITKLTLKHSINNLHIN